MSYTKNINLNEDDLDDDQKTCETQLGYFKRTQQAQLLDVWIDGTIREPAYYRQVCQAIQDSSEGDIIRFHINSPGGRLDSLQSLLSSIWKTEATTEAHIEGAAHSAASMLALNCDAIYVSPVAEMLCHYVRFGTEGKAADIRGYVTHIENTKEKLFRETYKDFLNDEEIARCLDGYEMWLDSETYRDWETDRKSVV